ncbi:L-galactose dehydrogenase [Fonsecaea nubica]|uniref:L-galactose dehydrogenase n=1 Tax=Fonsecaea nubica TaxID=856822 RepID=A0A178DED7_9EURO|nr:L-galactose dehydrogenase [Fonsecaea nubica]OAL39583.1 L-galactose dehydrogenase [Fonsecaea nubica]
MPTILTPQGWVKVAPPPPRKRPVNHDPKAVFRGPLAYLACQRSKPPPLNIGGGGNIKGRAEFPYDLSASPEKLRRQGEVNARSKADRSVSAPVMHGGLHPRDDDYDDYDDEVEDVPAPEVQRRRPRTPKSIEQPKPKSRSTPFSYQLALPRTIQSQLEFDFELKRELQIQRSELALQRLERVQRTLDKVLPPTRPARAQQTPLRARGRASSKPVLLDASIRPLPSAAGFDAHAYACADAYASGAGGTTSLVWQRQWQRKEPVV